MGFMLQSSKTCYKIKSAMQIDLGWGFYQVFIACFGGFARVFEPWRAVSRCRPT